MLRLQRLSRDGLGIAFHCRWFHNDRKIQRLRRPHRARARESSAAHRHAAS